MKEARNSTAISRNTVSPRISPLGLIYFLCFLGGGLFEGACSRGFMKLFDKFRIKSSFQKLLFSILLQEQSIFKH